MRSIHALLLFVIVMSVGCGLHYKLVREDSLPTSSSIIVNRLEEFDEGALYAIRDLRRARVGLFIPDVTEASYLRGNVLWTDSGDALPGTWDGKGGERLIIRPNVLSRYRFWLVQ